MEIITGLHTIRLSLKTRPQHIQEILFDTARHDHKLTDLLEQAKNLHIPINGVDRIVLERLANGTKHQGIVARITAPLIGSETTLETIVTEAANTPCLLLILDGVQDPHNLGACLRTAEAAGVAAVVVPKDRAVGLTPTVCKAASGAASLVPFIQVTNLARTLRTLQACGIRLIGASETAATSVYQTDLSGNIALIIGGEERGLRRLTRDHCDGLVSLPMLGVVESLNVSVATGILLYEALRQRGIQTN